MPRLRHTWIASLTLAMTEGQHSPKTDLSWRRNERFCARWSPEIAGWRGAPRVAIFFRKANQRECLMPLTAGEKRAAFRTMHKSGCFVLPNPYDVGSAMALQHMGFKAIASTSAGFAWSIGKADNRVTLEDVLQHLTALCKAVDLPVNADFEGAFAHEAGKVAANLA